jgi:hypothetical protein
VISERNKKILETFQEQRVEPLLPAVWAACDETALQLIIRVMLFTVKNSFAHKILQTYHFCNLSPFSLQEVPDDHPHPHGSAGRLRRVVRRS